ncbi:MAG: VOC family protein [Armatimonadetes bacterium]|nr:VOC family protein [Armatimonadota bacterium]
MGSNVEHANLSVRDVDASVRFLLAAMPDFVVRHDSGPGPGRWVHLGNDATYIALNAMDEPGDALFAHCRPGLNHIGFVVDDADALRERMLAAGYAEGYQPAQHPQRTRVYFVDGDGIEWEFVSYLPGGPALRNDYSAG